MAKSNFKNFIEGVDTQISPLMMKDNKLRAASNVVTHHKLGEVLKRLGYSQVDSSNLPLESGKKIRGLHNFRQDPDTQKMLATINDSTDDDTQLFYKTPSGSWTEETSAETAWAGVADTDVDMEDFITYCFIVGYSDTDGFLPIRTFQGTSIGTTNVSGAPNAKYVERYRDRIYLANCEESSTHEPYRVYFSSVPASGSISWDTSTDFFDVDYSEEITGLQSNWDKLVIFTEFSAYFYNQSSLYKEFDVGCSNNRTIRNISDMMLWANQDGVFASTGGKPKNISGRIKDFVRYANPKNFFAETVNEEYHLYVGDVTVNGISYSNTTIIYDTNTKTWRVAEYNDNFNIFAQFTNNGNSRIYMGTDGGDVMDLSQYTDANPVFADDGASIHSFFRTKYYDFGDPSVEKDFNKVLTYARRAQGANLRARVVNANNSAVTDFKKLGELQGFVNEYTVEFNAGHFIQFELSEMSDTDYWSLYGFTVDADSDDQLT